MRRRLLIVLLTLGTVGGYASGFASVARHRSHMRHHCHQGSWEQGRSPNGPHGRWEASSHPGAPSLAATVPTIHIAHP